LCYLPLCLTPLLIPAEGGGDGVSEEQALLHASTIFQMSSQIEQAYMRMRIMNSCGDEEISFHHAGWGHNDYQHPSPIRDDCNLYHADGGSLPFIKTMPAGINDGADIMFTSDAMDAPLPNSSSDANLSFMIPNVTDSVCRAINRQLGFDEVLMDQNDYLDSSVTLYKGTFDAGDGLLGLSNDCTGTPICDTPSFCFTESSGGQKNIFVTYLLDRGR